MTAQRHANMVAAFAAANKGDWMKARGFATLTGDPAFNALLQWRYLVESGMAAPFSEINSFLQAHPNWPRRDQMISTAERVMPAFIDPRLVIQWYAGRTPSTAQGKVRLGEAFLATGDRDKGAALIRKGWVEGNFSPADEAQIFQAHVDILGQADHRARLAQLLARNDTIGARRQMARVDADAQRIANARLTIKQSPALVNTVFASLPSALQNDAELRFDTARALRRRNQDEDAWKMLADTPAGSTPLADADERWTERHIMTRDALKTGKYDLAYRLVSRHGMETGGNFADAEFLAGWIALRFLKKPEWALDHFRSLASGVNLPISKARAYYWLGRTYQDLGQTADAVTSYRKAAEARETFYGQLALARIQDQPTLVLKDTTWKPTRQDLSAFDSDERIAAIKLLADLNDRDRFRLFAVRIASDTPNAEHLELLAQLMNTLNDPAMAVRVGKIASYSGIVLPSRLAPTMPLPKYPGKGIEPDSALVLGLTRQESEFDPKAVSGAGARGLMQIMPASAKKVAAAHGVPYKLADLVAKPQYNMQLGMAAISDYLDHWGGSYVLAIASYNAGPGNVTRWIEANGDPRDPTVDPIDWIESIPFAETRNYVQRVLENVEIYRSRLSTSKRLNILTDLYRPLAPKAIVIALDTAQSLGNLPSPVPAPERPVAAPTQASAAAPQPAVSP
jgi:peptidoglycan lytic transglycosylase